MKISFNPSQARFGSLGLSLVVVLCFLNSERSYGQSRIFVSGGVTTSLGGNFGTLFAHVPPGWSMDIEWDKKVMGSLYALSGVSTFGLGYSTTQDALIPSNSTFSARYVAIPIMARWNVGNRNWMYLDFGLNELILATARLDESVDKFGTGTLTTCGGNVAPYLNRLYQSFKFQETATFNRFSFSLFIVVQLKGQGSINNLADHWGLNRQQSTFLSSGGYSDFNLFGFKLSARIR